MACQLAKRSQSRPGAIIICVSVRACVCCARARVLVYLFVCLCHVNDGHLDMNCTKPIHTLTRSLTFLLPLSLTYSRFISLLRFLPVEWKRLELGQAGSNKKSSAPLVILIPAESLSRKIAKGSQLGRCTWWTGKWTERRDPG